MWRDDWKTVKKFSKRRRVVGELRVRCGALLVDLIDVPKSWIWRIDNSNDKC